MSQQPPETQDQQSLLERGYVEVALTSQVGPVMPKRVELQGQGILLCRDGERLFALDELCPHKQKSMAYGLVMEGKLTCPHHQYGFDLETGRCSVRRCEPVQTYPLEIIADRIFIKPMR